MPSSEQLKQQRQASFGPQVRTAFLLPSEMNALESLKEKEELIGRVEALEERLRALETRLHPLAPTPEQIRRYG